MTRASGLLHQLRDVFVDRLESGDGGFLHSAEQVIGSHHTRIEPVDVPTALYSAVNTDVGTIHLRQGSADRIFGKIERSGIDRHNVVYSHGDAPRQKTPRRIYDSIRSPLGHLHNLNLPSAYSSRWKSTARSHDRYHRSFVASEISCSDTIPRVTLAAQLMRRVPRTFSNSRVSIDSLDSPSRAYRRPTCHSVLATGGSFIPESNRAPSRESRALGPHDSRTQHTLSPRHDGSANMGSMK